MNQRTFDSDLLLTIDLPWKSRSRCRLLTDSHKEPRKRKIFEPCVLNRLRFTSAVFTIWWYDACKMIVPAASNHLSSWDRHFDRSTSIPCRALYSYGWETLTSMCTINSCWRHTVNSFFLQIFVCEIFAVYSSVAEPWLYEYCCHMIQYCWSKLSVSSSRKTQQDPNFKYLHMSTCLYSHMSLHFELPYCNRDRSWLVMQ